MYPSGEVFSQLASVAFLNAMQDANMLQPTSIGTALLFPKGAFDIRLGDDAGMVSSNRTIVLPLTSVIISIGRPYGVECGYGAPDPLAEAADATDMDIWIPFTVYDNSSEDQDYTEQKLLFARDKRQNVFSSHGLNIKTVGIVGSKPRPDSSATGLVITDYRWRFFYSRQ